MKTEWNIKKEMMQSIRQYKFLIVFTFLIFFAIMTPLMSKLVLPQLLTNYYPDLDPQIIEQMLGTTQTNAISGFLGDMFEMGTLLIVFLYSGIIAQEIGEKTFVLPLCSGKKYTSVIISKIIVNGPVLILSMIAAVLVNYYYSGVFFDFTAGSIKPATGAAALQGLYMVFILSLLIFIGALVKKPLMTGMIALVPAYGIGLIGKLFNIEIYLPSGLMIQAQKLMQNTAENIWHTVSATLLLIVALLIFSVKHLKRSEFA